MCENILTIDCNITSHSNTFTHKFSEVKPETLLYLAVSLLFFLVDKNIFYPEAEIILFAS